MGHFNANFTNGRTLFELFLLISFSFPINIILVSVIPTIMLALFVKISLRRFLNWWNANFGESRFNWNIEKALDEYLSILKKDRKSFEEKS
ncbi:MAG: hypothetical protein QW791_02695 [Candidatus Bathyarchaeia archaeon]